MGNKRKAISPSSSAKADGRPKPDRPTEPFRRKAGAGGAAAAAGGSSDYSSDFGENKSTRKRGLSSDGTGVAGAGKRGCGNGGAVIDLTGDSTDGENEGEDEDEKEEHQHDHEHDDSGDDGAQGHDQGQVCTSSLAPIHRSLP